MVGVLFGLLCIVVQRNLLTLMKPDNLKIKIEIFLSLISILFIFIYFGLISNCATTEACNDLNFYFSYLIVSKKICLTFFICQVCHAHCLAYLVFNSQMSHVLDTGFLKPFLSHLSTYSIFLFEIFGFLWLRNCHAFLQKRYSFFFAWFGQFSLELFIAQFHIWNTSEENGSISTHPEINF